MRGRSQGGAEGEAETGTDTRRQTEKARNPGVRGRRESGRSRARRTREAAGDPRKGARGRGGGEGGPEIQRARQNRD